MPPLPDSSLEPDVPRRDTGESERHVPAAPTARLVELLGDLGGGLDVDHGELERAVCEYTRALRETGARPERILVAVKTLAEAAGLPRQDGANTQVSVGRLAQWCIKEYYRAD
jgi:hypothetical protein